MKKINFEETEFESISKYLIRQDRSKKGSGIKSLLRTPKNIYSSFKPSKKEDFTKMLEMIQQLEKNFENEGSNSRNRLINLETMENLGLGEIQSLPKSGTSKISEINAKTKTEVEVFSNKQLLELLKMQVQKLMLEQQPESKYDERTFIDLGSQTGPEMSHDDRINYGFKGFVHQDIIKSINNPPNQISNKESRIETINYGIIDRDRNLIPHKLTTQKEVTSEQDSLKKILTERLDDETRELLAQQGHQSKKSNITSIQVNQTNRDITSSFQTQNSKGKNSSLDHNKSKERDLIESHQQLLKI